MQAWLERMARRLRGDAGFTLVELLMSTVLGLLVVGIGVMVFTAALHSQPELSKRGDAISTGRTSMERLTRELRQGATVVSASANQLAFVTYVHSPASCAASYSSTSNPCRVTYTCTTTGCSRVQAKPDGTGASSSQPIVTGLSNPNVFTYSPSSTAPTYIGATFAFAGSNGHNAITVSDGVTLRNPAPPAS